MKSTFKLAFLLGLTVLIWIVIFNFVDAKAIPVITGSNNSVISPSPLPKQLYCGRSDLTSTILSHFPSANYLINDIIKLQDVSGKILVVLTQTTGGINPNSKDMWLYNLGADGVFSNDDFVTYVYSISLPSYGYVGKITGGLTPSTEKLYWIEEHAYGQRIMTCNLPSCTSKNVLGTLTNYSAIEIIPSTTNDGLYLNVQSINVGEESIISCSFNSSNYDWCGLPDDFYAQRLNLLNDRYLIGKAMREQGVGYETINYPYNKFFFDINNNMPLSLPRNSLPNSIHSSLMINQGLILMDSRPGFYDIASFDISTGNIISVQDSIPVSYNSQNYFITYPRIISKVWIPTALRYDFIKKDFGLNPITFFSQSGIGQQVQITQSLFMLPNGQVISADKFYNSNNLSVYGYDCTP